MITHVVTFRWKPEATPDAIAAIADALSTMPELVKEIATYRFGSDLAAHGPANMDFAIIATFDSIEDWRAYDKNPGHDRIRAEVIGPWVAERAAVQFRS